MVRHQRGWSSAAMTQPSAARSSAAANCFSVAIGTSPIDGDPVVAGALHPGVGGADAGAAGAVALGAVGSMNSDTCVRPSEKSPAALGRRPRARRAALELRLTQLTWRNPATGAFSASPRPRAPCAAARRARCDSRRAACIGCLHRFGLRLAADRHVGEGARSPAPGRRRRARRRAAAGRCACSAHRRCAKRARRAAAAGTPRRRGRRRGRCLRPRIS